MAALPQKPFLGSGFSLSMQSGFPKPRPNLRPQKQPQTTTAAEGLSAQACSYLGLWVNSCPLSSPPGMLATLGLL